MARQLPKRERRELQRELAREEREREAIQRRRRRIAGWIIGPIAAALVLVLAGGIVVLKVREGMVGPANMLSDGLLEEGAGDDETFAATATAALAADEDPTENVSTITSTGVLDIQLYLDPTDAQSATFWSAQVSDLESFLQQSAVTVELHPVSFDGSDAGTAAVAAFGCVADAEPDQAWAYLNGMLEATAAGTVPTGDALLDLATDAGVSEADTQDCITGGGFRSWASAASERARESVPYATETTAVDGAPVIVAAGQVYTGDLADADAFFTFLSDAYAAAVSG